MPLIVVLSDEERFSPISGCTVRYVTLEQQELLETGQKKPKDIPEEHNEPIEEHMEDLFESELKDDEDREFSEEDE